MNIIVSSELNGDKFNNYIVVDSFKRASEVKGITTLIIHKFKESDFDAGVFISNLHNSGISNFVYITDSPSSTMLMVIKGVDGNYIEDEFYFDDEEELDALLEDLGMESQNEESTDLAAPALDVLSDFIQSFVRGEERIKAPLYLEQVKDAVTALSTITQQQELQLTTMGNSAIEIFERASTIIKGIDSQRKIIEKKLEEIEFSAANATSSKPSFGNNVMFFTPYKYIGNSKVLVIREYAPCRYLTSFVLGYLNHLHYELNKRPKLIFVHQKGQGVSAKYSDYTAITQDSMNIASLYDAEIVATNNPKKEVLRDLLMKPNDVIIVVDRLYGKDTIVTGRVTTVNAVGSKSDIKRYNIKPEDTIFSITSQPKQLFCLAMIKSFPPEVDARIAAYTQVMQPKYVQLDTRLGIRR